MHGDKLKENEDCHGDVFPRGEKTNVEYGKFQSKPTKFRSTIRVAGGLRWNSVHIGTGFQDFKTEKTVEFTRWYSQSVFLV